MTAQIPVTIKTIENQLPRLKSEFAALSAQEKKSINDKLRNLSFQRRLENEINRELKQQISERRRLVQLSEKLNRDLAKQQGAGMLGGMPGGLIKGAIGLGVGAAATDFTKDSFMMAAASERLEKATHNLGRQYSLTGEQITNAIRSASDNTINSMDAMQAANKAMLFGIVDNQQEFEELTKIGVGLGRAMGLDAKTSIDDFTTALGRQSKLILDNLGIIVNTEDAYKKYAAQLGKSVSDLSDAEKQQAFVTAALEAGREKLKELGDQEIDTAGKVERLTANWADFQAEFGKLLDDSGSLDALNSFLEQMITGAKEWQTVIGTLNDLRDAQKQVTVENIKAGDSFSANKEAAKSAIEAVTPLPRWMLDYADGLFAAVTGNEQLAEAVVEANKAEEEQEENLNRLAKQRAHIQKIEEARLKQQEEANKLMEEEVQRLEKVADARDKFARSLIDIDEAFRKDVDDTWDKYFEDEEQAWEDHNKTLEDLDKKAAKELVKIDKDLQKDLAKNQRELQKDLAKITKDENKAIEDLHKKRAKEEKQQRKLRQIDAKGDERLFQLDLKNLAAEGEANAIAQALERRKIEEEINREKQAAEKEIEEENFQDEIDRVREQAEEDRAEARARAEEKAQELRDQAEEEKQIALERLAEEKAAEEESYLARLEDLRNYRDEKLDNLQQSREESIATLAEELAEMGLLTETELKQLAPVAGEFGEEAGGAFARGLNDEFAKQERISSLLGDLAREIEEFEGSGSAGGSGSTSESSSGGNVPLRFAEGGSFTVGGSGGVDSQLVRFMATPGERVTVTPSGSGSFVFSPTIYANPDMQARLQSAFQEFIDTVLVPMLSE